MKKERRADRRVAQTKAAIRAAYLKLLEQKDVSEITVTDIAQQAGVDRKTVYNYYEGTDAILEELENELVSRIGKMFSENDFLRCAKDPLGFLESITNAFSQNKDLTDPLIRKNKRSQVLQKLGDVFSGRLSVLLGERVHPQKKPYAKLYADFLTSGMVSVYRDWLATGKQQSLDEIAKQLSLFLGGGIAAFIGA